MRTSPQFYPNDARVSYHDHPGGEGPLPRELNYWPVGEMHTSQENETIVDSWLFVIVSGVQVLQRQWRRCGEVQQKDGCPVYTAYRLPRGGAEFWWVVAVFDEQFHTGPQSILQDKPQQPPLTGNARLNARSRPRAGVINSHANLQAHPRRKRVFNPGRPGLP